MGKRRYSRQQAQEDLQSLALDFRSGKINEDYFYQEMMVVLDRRESTVQQEARGG